MTAQEAFDSWCQQQNYDPDDFLKAEMVWLAACAWQREEDARIAENYGVQKTYYAASGVEIPLAHTSIATAIRQEPK